MTKQMLSLSWDESWSTGVQQFDDDHKHLIGLYNNLFLACFAGQGPSVIVKMLEQLIAYAEDHFGRENELFERLAYPEKDEHIEQHEELIADLHEIKEHLKRDEAHTVSNETLEFLIDWIETHTKDMDRKYEAFMHEHGVV